MDSGISATLRRRRMSASILRIVILIALAFPATTSVRAAGPWYVAPSGLDSNSCTSPAAPCLTINSAIGKAAAGDTIRVAIGTYTRAGSEVVLIDRNITLLGGWDDGFSAQSGRSILDGLGVSRGLTIIAGVTVVLNSFAIQNGFHVSEGGGIRNAGTLTVTNAVVSGNLSNMSGGGIYNSGTLTLNGSSIQNNTANILHGMSGGGIFNSGTLNINGSTISGNTAAPLGGGGYVGGAAGILNTGSLTLNNSTMSGNTNSIGAGGIRNDGLLTLNNTTVTGNSTGGHGGGILTGGSPAIVRLQNSILAGNSASYGPDCAGADYAAMVSAGYNLIGSTYGCSFFTATTGDQVGTYENPIDPRLQPLGSNGGLTLTHALQLDSPARNAGNPASPGSGGDACLATDQRGVARPFGDACDIGAYEADVLLVQSLARTSPSPTSAYTVHFTLKFTDTVTGVNTDAPFSDFGLTSAGLTGAAITSVSGSGDTYQVTVNVGSGVGTIRLDVLDDDTILELTGHPLGGVGSGNGSFTGPVYTIVNPRVISILRANPNPTSASSVKFNVKFSEPVTGADKVAPFSDFTLTTTGLTGAAITGVSGTGASYVVTVKTGQGNGTLQLKLLDDDSILSKFGRPLGGPGAGNGSLLGPTYTVRKIPTLLSPATINTWDRTPTYKWSKIPAATQYQLQVWRGTTLVYTRSVWGGNCGVTTCTNTPSILLPPATYKWRVRAAASGIWLPFSPYKTFSILGPKAGYWASDWTDFYVTADRADVMSFSIYISPSGCGSYKITYTALAPINDRKFSFTGSFYARGTFATTGLSASGTAGLYYFYIPGCGYISGGPYAWYASWGSASLPEPGAAIELLPLPGPEGTFPGPFMIEPVQP
jgi:hypothetical protein